MSRASNEIRRAKPLLGTFVEIAAAGEEPAIDAAFNAVAKVHRLMSFQDRDSDVSRLNCAAAARAVCVDPWTYRVLGAAVELHRLSAGLFDVTRATGRRDAVELLGDHHVRLPHPRVSIDLSGIAKGFAVDRAVDALRAHGVRAGLVNAGGDLAAFGPAPQTIHLRDPRDPRRLLCRRDLADAALASSGRGFDPFRCAQPSRSAIIDPRTGSSVAAIIGVSVCAPTCMIADALTKVVMIAGEGALALLTRYAATAMLVTADGEVRATADWQEADLAA